MPVLNVDLPSGQKVEVRDKLKAKDRFAAQAAMRVHMTADGEQDATGAIVNDMRNALLTSLVQSWTVTGDDGQVMPIPREAPVINAMTGETRDVLGEMDIDDYNALADAIQPLMNKVTNSPNRSGRSGS
jgi:hypothetical protein